MTSRPVIGVAPGTGATNSPNQSFSEAPLAPACDASSSARRSTDIVSAAASSAILIASGAAQAALAASTVALAAAQLCAHVPPLRVRARAAPRAAKAAGAATTRSLKPSLSHRARGRAVSIATLNAVFREGDTFEERCTAIIDRLDAFVYRRMSVGELLDADGAVGATLTTIRAAIAAKAFGENMSLFSDAVRACARVRWSALPIKSAERSAITAAAKFFDQLVAGPRCSPRNISGGYRAAATKKTAAAAVFTPAFRVVAPPPCSNNFRRTKERYITFSAAEYADLESILLETDAPAAGAKTTSRARAATAAANVEKGRWSADYDGIFHPAIWTDPFVPETAAESAKRCRRTSTGAPPPPPPHVVERLAAQAKAAAAAAAAAAAHKAAASRKGVRGSRRGRTRIDDVLDPTDRRPAKGQKAVSHYRGVSWNKADSKVRYASLFSFRAPSRRVLRRVHARAASRATCVV